jgi:hypothetical protein
VSKKLIKKSMKASRLRKEDDSGPERKKPQEAEGEEVR